jgi:membrane protease YdiL (CAAX protease family)
MKALFSLQAGLFVSLFLRGAMGEELGLRGFALPRLQENNSPFRSSLIIGILWGAWHLPVLIGRDVLSIVAFSLLAIGLSFLFTLMFNGSGGSLIPVLLFHATQNWEDGFEVIFPALVGTDWELVSTLALILIGVVAGVLVWKKRRL